MWAIAMLHGLLAVKRAAATMQPPQLDHQVQCCGYMSMLLFAGLKCMPSGHGHCCMISPGHVLCLWHELDVNTGEYNTASHIFRAYCAGRVALQRITCRHVLVWLTAGTRA